MKNHLITAIVAISMLTSCNKKADAETENTKVQATEVTEQQSTSMDSVNKTDSINQIQSEQDQIKAHGHAH